MAQVLGDFRTEKLTEVANVIYDAGKMTQVLGDFRTEKLTEIAIVIYDTGKMTEALSESVFIALPPKRARYYKI